MSVLSSHLTPHFGDVEGMQSLKKGSHSGRNISTTHQTSIADRHLKSRTFSFGYRLLTGFMAAFLLLAVLAGCTVHPSYNLDEVRRRVIARDALDEVTGSMQQGGAGSPGTKASIERDARSETEDPFGAEVDHLDLNAAILYALDHNPHLQAARYRFRAAEAGERAAGWLPDPRFSWSHAFEEIQTRNGPVRDTFTLSQKFPYWGKLHLKSDIAGAEAAAKREAFLSTQLAVIRDVQRSYFDIYLTTQEMKINDRTRGILKRFVDIALKKVSAGTAGQSDILLAEIELSRLENERIDLDQRLQTERALLNTHLNRKPSAPLPPVSVSDPEYEYEGKVDELVSWMLEHLPDIRRHRHLVQRNQSRVRLSKLRYLPDVTVGVNYKNVGRSPVAAGAVDSGEDGIGGMLGLNLPLWISKYSAETGAARKALAASRAALANVELFSVYKVLEMHIRVETALRQVTFLHDVVLPKAAQTLEVLEKAYETGSMDFLKLLDAEQALERFELEYERARTEFKKRYADLERAVGKPLRKETIQ